MPRSDVGAVGAVKRIDAIFDIEREVNGRSIKDRLAARLERVAPMVTEFSWLRCKRNVASSRVTAIWG